LYINAYNVDLAPQNGVWVIELSVHQYPGVFLDIGHWLDICRKDAHMAGARTCQTAASYQRRKEYSTNASTYQQILVFK